MSARGPRGRLAYVRSQSAKLAAEVAALERRSARYEEAVRTRRKVLVGSCVLARIEAGTADAPELLRILRDALPEYIDRQLDRELVQDLLTLEEISVGEDVRTRIK